jgi:Ca-activated chloride channel family protein
VAPRYGSRRAVHLQDAGSPPDEVDRDVFQPLLAEDAPRLNPIRITVELDPGQPIVPPTSRSHRLEVTRSPGDAGTRYRLRTVGEGEAQEVADRDFVLSWAPVSGALPVAALRHEHREDGWYGVMVVTPPAVGTSRSSRLPRELTFVVDTSGSMGGESIAQARSALDYGLGQLQEDDSFNVIQFNRVHSSLFPAPRPATAENLRRARRYIAGLRADGGTEMRGAVRQALSAPLAQGLVGQVVFITDGAIDYEDDLVGLVSSLLGERRLFTVGIGSAPNGYFMRKAAELGGGSFTYIGDTAEVESRMAALFGKIAHPMSTDLAVEIEGGTLAEPLHLPRDLYAGEPLVVALRFGELPRAVSVSAAAGDGADRWRIPVAMSAAPDSGLHVLWARSRIETLSDAIRRARHTALPQDELRGEVVQIALAHHLVSDYTSLVAVDLSPARPADEPLRHGDVPANLPSGWDYGTLTGQEARDAAVPAVLRSTVTVGGATGMLARTATPAPLQLLVGLVLIAAGFLLLVSRRGSRFLAAGDAQ